MIIGPNCTFIDNEKITIGSSVMIAPNVQIYTSYHPILPEDRYIYDRAENVRYILEHVLMQLK